MNTKFFLKLLTVIIIALVVVALMDKSCLPSEKDGHEYLMQMLGQSYLENMKQDDLIAFFHAHGYFNRIKNNYNSSVIQVEVDRSFSVQISAEDLKKVFEKVEYSYRLAGINLKIHLDDTLLSVGHIKNVGDLRNCLKKTRNHRDMIHVIIADEVNAPIFGWTQFLSSAKFPNQDQLDKVGTYIFYNNIREYSNVDSITFDYYDSVITIGELLTKVLIHEIGHNLCLIDNPSSYFENSMYSVMNQGYRVTIVNGANNQGPEFSGKDLKCMDLNMILGIDRTMRFLKPCCDPNLMRNVCSNCKPKVINEL